LDNAGSVPNVADVAWNKSLIFIGLGKAERWVERALRIRLAGFNRKWWFSATGFRFPGRN